MNIVAYCRVSTDKEDQLNSLETQKAFFEEYAKRNNHNLIKVYADEGISGTRIKNRKQFLQLMKDSDNGLFKMVAVKDISRLARNAVDFLQCIRDLKSKGIACNFVNTNLSSQDGEMVLGTLALVAQEESANTSKRIKFSKKINAQKGRVPNIVYGYDKIIGDYFNLTINKEEAEIVKRIYAMYAYEGMGQYKIATKLNDEGIRTKRGCKWSQNAIARILTNQIYIGNIINGKEEIEDFLTGKRKEKDEGEWIIISRPELRIIDDESFNAVQKILNKRNDGLNIPRERRSNKHVFSTLIKCSCCGYSFRRIVRTYKNTYIDWVCSGRNTNGASSCPNKTVLDEGELLEVIRKYFISLITDKQNTINNVIKEFNRIYKSRDNNEDREKCLNAKLCKVKKDKQRYIDMNLNDIINMDELKAKTKEHNKEIERLENEIKIVQFNLNKGNELEQILNATFKDMEDLVNMDTTTNAMLKRVIQKIIVDDEGNVDIYLNLFSEIGLDSSILVCNDCT